MNAPIEISFCDVCKTDEKNQGKTTGLFTTEGIRIETFIISLKTALYGVVL